MNREDKMWTIGIFAFLIIFGALIGSVVVVQTEFHGKYASLWADDYNWSTIPTNLHWFILSKIDVWFGFWIGMGIGLSIAMALEIRSRICQIKERKKRENNLR